LSAFGSTLSRTVRFVGPMDWRGETAIVIHSPASTGKATVRSAAARKKR
jgi:hypothetical protein